MRRLHDLVSVYPEQASTSTTGTVKSKGVFITIESLLTFPVASTSVVIIWKVLGAVVPGWGQSAVVPVVTSFVIGILLYFISVPENATKREKMTGLVVSVINCFFLAASALGIDVAIS